MIDQQPLLSICLPTYNGAQRIGQTLSYLIEGVKLCSSSALEIIIVDNCSEDDTKAVVESYDPRLSHVQYKYIKNPRNLGYNNSVKKIIQEYATGVYIWLIGDDDFINPHVLPVICETLKLQIYDYIALDHVIVKNRIEIDEALKTRCFNQRECHISEAIDKNKESNLIATFMSTSIGRLDEIKRFSFEVINSETWSDYKSVFPISFIMISSFHKSKCLSISPPSIICLIQEKNWDNKLLLMNVKFIPELLYIYESKYKMHLPKSRDIISKNLTRILFSNPRLYKYINLNTIKYAFNIKNYKTLCLNYIRKSLKR